MPSNCIGVIFQEAAISCVTYLSFISSSLISSSLYRPAVWTTMVCELDPITRAWLLFTVAFLVTTTAQQGDLLCAQCFSAVSPSDCQHGVWCGKGETCFTREFVDHQGRQSFRLGCETVRNCNMFLSAQYLIGKRDNDNIPEMCYHCCSDNVCNSKLCLNAVKHPHTGPASHRTCPPTFTPYNGHCYYIATWLVTWSAARRDCQRRGAELVSINSKLEQDFLVQTVDKLNTTQYPPAIWTGGFWVPATTQWNWLDNTAVNFTAWGKSYPTSPDDSYHIAMVKDSTQLTSGGWLWSDVVYSSAYGFICERSMS